MELKIPCWRCALFLAAKDGGELVISLHATFDEEMCEKLLPVYLQLFHDRDYVKLKVY